MPTGDVVPDLYTALLKDPVSMIDACYYDGYRLGREQIEAVQLEGARKRFRELRPHLSVMDKLAAEQGIEAIGTLDDLAPLIFAHTVYKSYPTSFIEKNRYDRMTRWLNGLTVVELAAVDTDGIDSIDGWMDALDEQTELRVFHTSGTSGKLSFVPRTRDEWRQQILIRAFGARCVHIIAGNSPIVAYMRVIRNALTRSDCITKAPSNDPLTAIAIARTMVDMAPDHPVTRHLVAGYWKGGDARVEEAIYDPRKIEKIIAWGGFASVKHITQYRRLGIRTG
jgi:Acyl-CoA reductase (LuxC)